METEKTLNVAEETLKSKYPVIRDRTGASIAIIFLCGLLPGLIALIYTNRATNLYRQALTSDIEGVRDALYAKAVRRDRASKAWIIIGFAIPAIFFLIMVLAAIFYN